MCPGIPSRWPRCGTGRRWATAVCARHDVGTPRPPARQRRTLSERRRPVPAPATASRAGPRHRAAPAREGPPPGAAAGSPTARIQPVPLTCSAAWTVVVSPSKGASESTIGLSFQSARGAACRPPCHQMLMPAVLGPNRPQGQTTVRLMASSGGFPHWNAARPKLA